MIEHELPRVQQRPDQVFQSAAQVLLAAADTPGPCPSPPPSAAGRTPPGTSPRRPSRASPCSASASPPGHCREAILSSISGEFARCSTCWTGWRHCCGRTRRPTSAAGDRTRRGSTSRSPRAADRPPAPAATSCRTASACRTPDRPRRAAPRRSAVCRNSGRGSACRGG